jgi:hypothetical protein
MDHPDLRSQTALNAVSVLPHTTSIRSNRTRLALLLANGFDELGGLLLTNELETEVGINPMRVARCYEVGIEEKQQGRVIATAWLYWPR